MINISGTGSELVRTESDYRTDREMPIDKMQRARDVATSSRSNRCKTSSNQ